MRLAFGTLAPCPVDWASLAAGGDPHTRACASCGHEVLDLTTCPEGRALAALSGDGRTCVRAWRRADGALLLGGLLALGAAPPPPAPAETPAVATSAGCPLPAPLPAGALHLQVIDADDLPVPGALVTVEGPDRTVQLDTDAEGWARFADVGAGTWRWSAARAGFDPTEGTVTVDGSGVALRVRLASGTFALYLGGITTWRVLTVQTDEAARGVRLDRPTLERLPR